MFIFVLNLKLENMKTQQLADIILKLDQKKRIKFQNCDGWGNKTMAANAIIEHGGAYIFTWTATPGTLLMHLKDDQKLIWYNPLNASYKSIKKYFPDYEHITNCYSK